MALSTRQKTESRKDIAAGKAPALTTLDEAAVDGAYGAEKASVVKSSRLRSAGQDLGLLT
jgi:hypothetical protein